MSQLPNMKMQHASTQIFDLAKSVRRSEEFGTKCVAFDDKEVMSPAGPITIRAKGGVILDSLAIQYEKGDLQYHGGTGGSGELFAINGDPVIRVTGQANVPFCGRSVISQLVFETRKGEKYGPYGESNGGKDFTLGEDGSVIMGFFGSSDGAYITSLGAYLLKSKNPM